MQRNAVNLDVDSIVLDLSDRAISEETLFQNYQRAARATTPAPTAYSVTITLPDALDKAMLAHQFRDPVSVSDVMLSSHYEDCASSILRVLSDHVTCIAGEQFEQPERLARWNETEVAKIVDLLTLAPKEVVRKWRDERHRVEVLEDLRMADLTAQIKVDHEAAKRQAVEGAKVAELVAWMDGVEQAASTDAQYLLLDFMPADGVTFIAAGPFGMKTFTAISIGLHIAAGAPWMGRAVSKAQ